MYADSEVHTRVNNNLIGDRFEDGRLSVEAEGVGYGAGISMLYSLSPDTRVGLTWNSQVNIDIDSEIDFRNVRLPPELIDRLQRQNDRCCRQCSHDGRFWRLPSPAERLGTHLGLAWVEFSKFGVTDISLEAGTINAPKNIYNDFFASTIGASWPINAKMRGAAGLLWVEEPMDESARTFGISMDEMWGSAQGLPTNWKVVMTSPSALTYSIRAARRSIQALLSPGDMLPAKPRITTHCCWTSLITGVNGDRGEAGR